MAVDAAKLKGLSRRGLGAPPREGMPELAGEGARDHAEQPVIAEPTRDVAPPKPSLPAIAVPAAGEPRAIVDGRTLRRSGRTVQLGTRVTQEFAVDLRADAAAANLLIVEILEEAVAARRRLLALARPGETLNQVVDRLASR